ncbi:nucleotidyltransferase [Nonomuraea turkmeniaca]|uniref:Nucleotidyltransferase n=1 Tax=Nonomuraea turkmeniaca TaxID=103838 RepID=A0A5S4FPE7_9ACTN|nr:nucleotidyltransferase domain-containing protein [Nonomuraea turkmeniaca]TMR22071.1 nucleotidyltransferase [Nonomuraea turkmeniaca]
MSEILLAGVVGSTAYGLAHAGSDIDRLGVFAAPTIDLTGLDRPDESVVTTKPDCTLHEAAKATRLLMSCNPTVTELLWLPSHLYEVRTSLGEELIGIRQKLLSAPRVRNAYYGYAGGQLRRLADRSDDDVPQARRARVAKLARHMSRLLEQGRDLYKTGRLDVVLHDPERHTAFGEQVADGRLDLAKKLLADAGDAFASIRSPLPDQPCREAAEQWLRRVRIAFWKV